MIATPAWGENIHFRVLISELSLLSRSHLNFSQICLYQEVRDGFFFCFVWLEWRVKRSPTSARCNDCGSSLIELNAIVFTEISYHLPLESYTHGGRSSNALVIEYLMRFICNTCLNYGVLADMMRFYKVMNE